MSEVTHNKLTSKHWGYCDEKEVVLFRFTNESGAFIEVTNFGATLVSVVVPDKYGNLENVVLGYPSLRGYLTDTCYIGSTIGRVANRIGGACFELDGVRYVLETNDGRNSNHSGSTGFHARVFDFTVEDDKLVLTLFSESGEGGFPGSIILKVEYGWSEDNELTVRYSATTDSKTVANFTNHAYFNLSPDRESIFDHQLSISSSNILETTGDHVPTGKIIPAGEKLFKGHRIYERIKVNEGVMSGINSYYIFDADVSERKNSPVCQLSDGLSGRLLTVFTSYPGVQVYTGDFLASTEVNNNFVKHKPFDGLCLECQHYPDAPNHPHFPSVTLEPGKVYHQHIVFKFGIKN